MNKSFENSLVIIALFAIGLAGYYIGYTITDMILAGL